VGILDVILGRDQNGKASKINMALIALMLWKVYQSTKGRAAPQPAPAPSPSGRRAEIPAPQPHQQTPQRQPLPAPDMSDGPDGGFKDLQDSMRRAPQYRRDTGGESGGGGGLGDILGDILGGGRGRPQAEPKAGPAGGGLGGGLDDILGEILGGGRGGSPRRGGGLGGGGLGDILGDILGGGRPGGARAMSEPQGDPLSALLQGAGGAGLGGLLGAGLGGLLQQFEEAGHGERAQSWISSGGNKSLSPSDIEQTFGADTIDAIAQQVGLPRSELLSGLAEALPQAVDQMTPDGRMPTPDEWSRFS
jgi:uncharacterized protein YidB (DUF937 family)